MSSEVEWLPLDLVVDAIIDRRGVTPIKLGGDFVKSGHRVISAKLIKNGRVQLEADTPRFVDSTIYKKWMKLPLLKGDVLMTSEAPLGEFTYLDSDRDWVLGQRLFAIRPKENVLIGQFLYYALQIDRVRADIQGRATGTTVQGIRQAELRLVKVPIPPLPEQSAAAQVLASLDDRITLLRETNATLESIAQALFKSWFVDFDPVRAKMEGRQPEGMDEETAALFPDSFEESELGLIPKGWRVAKFEDIVSRLSVGKKFDQKSASTEGAVPILDQGKSGVIGFHNESPGVPASLDDPVVVFANHTCYMRLITFSFSAIQNVLPFKGKNVDTIWAFYVTKDRIKFSEYKGHWPDFAIEKAVLPDTEVTQSFRKVVDLLVRRMRLNEMKAESIATLRDTLLPRLISGQLPLPEAENLITQ